ncbi:DUF4352 domain-containing protein [Streptomyces sp. NBC_00178]|uniref:DUF4352 domain-containing protein n=1 Tax=Streptomyces sp. NBC_00178 TaxID=2975672 RepID=UPI002E2D0CD4|nr:DUF4352 domain-containing protein [Streptomyces sp. NBC_00178]
MSHQEPQPGRSQQPDGGPLPQAPQRPRRQEGRRAGRIVGFSCLGVVGLVLVFAIGSAALLGGGEDPAPRGPEPAATASAAAAGNDSDAEPEGQATSRPAAGPVTLAVTRTGFHGSALADGTDYTSVRVTVTNNGGTVIGVDPLYFSLTGTDGSKHPAEPAVDENRIATVELAPGENVTGTVTGKGTFTPAYVTFVDGIGGGSVRGEVR